MQQNHFFYVQQHNPRGVVTTQSQRKLKKHRRRWTFADADKNEALNKTEFLDFLYPKTSFVWVAETLEDLDLNYDEGVDLQEFLAMAGDDNEKMKAYFQTLDVDQNGRLDLEEISVWIDPKGFVPVKSEVVYLVEILDTDASKDLSQEEILTDSDTFLQSLMTYYGQIFDAENDLRSDIFHIAGMKP